jgi:hypothetical protein
VVKGRGGVSNLCSMPIHVRLYSLLLSIRKVAAAGMSSWRALMLCLLGPGIKLGSHPVPSSSEAATGFRSNSRVRLYTVDPLCVCLSLVSVESNLSLGFHCAGMLPCPSPVGCWWVAAAE